MARLAETFLSKVWSLQPDGDFFVAVKDWQTHPTGTNWDDYPVNRLPSAIELPTKQDLYFCPNSFEQPRRLRKYAQPSRWLYADLDEVDPRPWAFFRKDEHNRDVGHPPAPTIAWRTSPGRYQALWLLDRTVNVRRFEWLNQRLTYFTGADRGGWSATKVLRVPGSWSNKRDTPYLVDLLWARKTVHRVEDLMRLLHDVPVLPSGEVNQAPLHLPSDSPAVLLSRYRRRLPARAKQLVRATTTTAGEDRSSRLWELENLLLDAGMKPEEVYCVVQSTVWNKYKGQRREQRMLWSEINKAAGGKKSTGDIERVVSHVSTEAPERVNSRESTDSDERAEPHESTAVTARAAPGKRTSVDERVGLRESAESSKRARLRGSTVRSKRVDGPESTVALNRAGNAESTVALDRADREESTEQQKRIRFVNFADFLTSRLARPTWLVQDIWGEQAHGVLAGEAKTFKSLFTLDLSVSVASGTPFLNHFQVPTTGAVMIVQEENEPGLVQDRLWRIASARALAPGANAPKGLVDFVGADLPIRIANNQGLDLTDDSDMRSLVRQIRKHRPVLVVLDPLYLMTPGIDENSAVEITPILKRLLTIKQHYNCGILLVHHFHKPKSEKSGRRAHRISGSSVFHRWYSSAIFVDAVDDEGTVAITSQHRGHGNNGGYLVKFDLGGDDDDLTYNIDIGRAPSDLEANAEPNNYRNGHDKEIVVVDTTEELMSVLKATTLGWYPIADAAEQLELSPNAVRKRAQRAGLEIATRRVNGRNRSAIKVPE